MNEQNDRYREELDQLLEQVDALFPELRKEEELRLNVPDFRIDDYTPEDARIDEPILYQNFSNNYGANLRNFSNNYGADTSEIPVYNGDFRQETVLFRPEELKETVPVSNGDPEFQDGLPEIPVYNGDFFREPQIDPEPEVPENPKQKPAPKRNRKNARGCCLGCLGMLLIPVVLVVVLVAGALGMKGPDAVDQTFPRKPNTSTILLVGTDAEGERTDTMMLLYLSGSEKRVGLLSLPRDTYTITSAGKAAKLNSAYIRNGQGKQGMEGLLDYIQDIIGYRPDGYLMVSMDIVPQIVDVMGGLTVDVPMSFELEGVTLEEGLQALNGTEVLQLLRYRKGYAMQDLGRVEVQRMVIGAAMEQWISPDRVSNALEALTLVQENCLTDLELMDLAWVAKTILLGRDQLQSHTLPGWAGYIGDASYYILYKDEVAALINESYNPFTTKITVDQLNIAG